MSFLVVISVLGPVLDNFTDSLFKGIGENLRIAVPLTFSP